MSTLVYVVVFVVALVVLLKSSDWFVEASERIGLSLGVSPFVIGVTIVAFGTSLPELASSVVSVLAGHSEIVAGNVIGSNVANVCLVLGLTAIVAKRIDIDLSVLDIDVPILFTSALLLWVFSRDGLIDVWEGVLLIGMLAIFLLNSFNTHSAPEGHERTAVGWRTYAMLVGGGVGVYFGADYTVTSITEISTAVGISPGIVAMSVVALGTSLPEVFVSVAAARKGKPELAIGNVVGSNIFNSFGVMGIPALFGEVYVPADQLAFSLPFMIGVTVLFVFLSAARNVSSWEGVTLLALYVIFVVELFR